VMTTLVSKPTNRQDSVDFTLCGGYGKLHGSPPSTLLGTGTTPSEFPYLPTPSSDHSVRRNVASDNHGQWCGIFHTHQSVLDGNITAEGSVWLAGTRFIRGTSFRGRSVAGLSGF